MSSHDQSRRLEDLLADHRWFRAVALRLAGADDRADDLVQETALAAIEGRPPKGSALKSWLLGVMRNLAHLRYREESRRLRRERLVAREEGVYSAPEDVIVRAELRAQIAEAVLGLKEPYRSVVLQRYFEGLSHAEIASQAEVPESTVRTWLSRAMVKLRSRLDRYHEGDRRAWLLPLSAGLGLGFTREAAGAATSAGTAVGAGSASSAAAAAGSGSTVSTLAVGGSLVMQKTAVAFSISSALVVGFGLGFIAESPGESSRAAGDEVVSRAAYEELQGRYAAAAAQLESFKEASTTSSADEAVDQDRGHRPVSRATQRGPGPLIPVGFPPGNYESLSDLLAAMTRPEYETGEGVITGEVLDYRTQEPVRGVLVRASPSIYWEKTSSGFAPPRPLTRGLEPSLREWLSKDHYERSTTVDVQSDASGIFELSGLREGRMYTIYPHHEGYEIEAAPGSDTVDTLPGAHVRLLAKRVVTFPVRVQFEDGTQPTKATIFWAANRGTRKWDSWFAHDPVISLRPDSYRLQAKAGAAGEFKSEQSEPVVVDSGRPPTEVVLTLRARQAILGKLVFSADQTPTSAFVYALRARSGLTTDARTLLRSGEKRLAHSRDSFSFRFTDISVGTYLVGASRDGAVIDTMDTVEVAEGVTERDLEVPDLPSEVFTTVLVVGPDDLPVADARVTVRYPSGWISGNGAAIEDSTGRFWVLNNRGGEGEHTVLASSIRYGTRSVPFLPGVPEVVVRFDDPGRLEVVVEGYVGSGLEGRLQVEVSKEGRAALIASAAEPLKIASAGAGGSLDAGGAQRFEPLEPGTYNVILGFVAGSRRPGRTLGSVRVDVQRGDNHVRLGIPPLHELTVRAASLRAGTRITLIDVSDGAAVGSNNVPPSGELGFEYLPPGSYDILYEAGGETKRRRVEIPSGGPIVVE